MDDEYAINFLLDMICSIKNNTTIWNICTNVNNGIVTYSVNVTVGKVKK